jgi:hypothetical protein
MTNRASSFALASAAMLAAGVARADFDVVVPNKAAVASSFPAVRESQTFRATVPRGATITAKLKAAKGSPELHAILLDAKGFGIGETTGAKPALSAVADASGTYAVTVDSDGDAVSGYTVAFSWKSAKSSGATVGVAPAGEGTLAFSADDGATASISLKVPKGSAALPSLVSIDGPGGSSTPLPAGRSASLQLSGSGDYVVHFSAGATGGPVSARVKVKAPKSRKYALHLVPGTVSSNAEVVAAKTIGPAGGELAIDDGPLAGSSVDVPAGAVATPTSFLLGVAAPVGGQQPGAAAGPAVFVGPEGLTFAGGKTVTVTIPYDPSAFPDGTSKLRVYTRDAAGNLALVPNPAIDAVAHVISFPASHFSAFQVLRDFQATETQRLLNGAGTPYRQLGFSVALAGDVAAAFETNAGGGGNLVAVFHRTGSAFAIETHLQAQPLQLDGFGAVMSASGSRLLVGAQLRRNIAGTQTGSAFVFVRDATGNWTQEAELSPATALAGDDVGNSVCLDGDTAIVGAPDDDGGANAAGAAHVFVRNAVSGSWSLQQTLRPAAPAAIGVFGLSVAVQGDTAVVGEPGCNRVHVYRRAGATWTEAGTFGAPDLDERSFFGSSVSLDGATIAVGAPSKYVDGSLHPSEIRVFEDQGAAFPQTARFTSADVIVPGESADFNLGSAVALRGDLLVGSAEQFDLVPAGPAPTKVRCAGNAFVFQRVGGTWRLALRLRGRADDAFPVAQNDEFGRRVALDGTTAIVGAYIDGTVTPAGGAAFVFDLSGN